MLVFAIILAVLAVGAFVVTSIFASKFNKNAKRPR